MAKELRGSSPTTTRYETEAEREHSHLRRLRLGDLSRWVRRGCSCRAEAKARASSPCPTRSGTSRYRKKSGSTPSNLTSTRLPITVIAKHHGAPWRSAGGVIRQCGSQPRQPSPSDFALRNRVRPEVSVSARRLCEHGNAHRRAADPMSTATNRTNAGRPTPCPPRPIESEDGEQRRRGETARRDGEEEGRRGRRLTRQATLAGSTMRADGTTSEIGPLLRLSIPIIIAQLGQMLLGMVDTVDRRTPERARARCGRAGQRLAGVHHDAADGHHLRARPPGQPGARRRSRPRRRARRCSARC